jgi:hypothetical protein
MTPSAKVAQIGYKGIGNQNAPEPELLSVCAQIKGVTAGNRKSLTVMSPRNTYNKLLGELPWEASPE